MTQTVNGQNKIPSTTPTPRQNRPGQRQQERLVRMERRRRRQRIWTSIIIIIVVLIGGGLGFWQYQQHLTAQQNAANAAATATRTAKTHLGPTCSTASTTPAVYQSTPTAGPKNPPVAAGTPARNSDGLQCLDLKVGTGTAAQPGSTVSVEYTGWLQSNGKKFDSSYDHGGQSFPVANLGQAQIIQGWNEGLVGMKVGGIRRLIIPPSLGYGTQSNQVIPANSTLIFDVIVVSVQ
ncbi:MAG TPA: FKBP-type peptidyl-prolyl cis-trans isomerase [Ktedonobacteraceae bacterium]|nr:FKBP-type peptidyl-prolyl cis-trans isomerase [Ktedonobacteraceae bacterium]